MIWTSLHEKGRCRPAGDTGKVAPGVVDTGAAAGRTWEVLAACVTDSRSGLPQPGSPCLALRSLNVCVFPGPVQRE